MRNLIFATLYTEQRRVASSRTVAFMLMRASLLTIVLSLFVSFVHTLTGDH